MGDFADDMDALSGLYEDEIDDLENTYYEMQQELSERKENKRTDKHQKFWETKNGERIKICDMSDSHLKNTIRFIRNYLESCKFNEF